MAVFLDTSLLVAVFHASDENHERALACEKRISAGDFGSAYTSDYVFDESVTLAFARSRNAELAFELGDSLLRAAFPKRLHVDEAAFREAWRLFEERSGAFSFTDCTTVVLMQRLGIRSIATFDREFDRLKGIERVC